MLSDLYEFCRAPYPWYLAPMGYRREVAGIAARSEEWASSWHAHLEATKQVILEAAERCPARDRVLILGSGLLLDLPLEDLSRRFGRVVLADIIHVLQVRRIARSYRNVELVQVDVTGVAKALFSKVRRRHYGTLPRNRVELFLDQPFDLVASVNLLSQLPVIPCQFLRSAHPFVTAAEIDRFARDLIESHLTWLRRFPARVALITDTAREDWRADRLLAREDLLGGLQLPEADRRWTWDIAPPRAGCCDREVRHKVAGFTDFTRHAEVEKPGPRPVTSNERSRGGRPG